MSESALLAQADPVWFSPSSQDGSLRVLTFRSGRVRQPQLILVPGWASTLDGWYKFLPGLIDHFDVHYLETREKSSSRLNPGANMSVRRMTLDLQEYISETIKSGRYVLVGASTGANIALDLYRTASDHLLPSSQVLILPHRRLPIPRYLPIFRFFPFWSLNMLKPILRVLIRTHPYLRKSPGQRQGALTVIEQNDLPKLRRSLYQWKSYRLDPVALRKRPSVPTLVIGASNDRSHSADSAIAIADAIAAEYFDGEAFEWGASAAAADCVRAFVQANDNKGQTD